MSSGVNMNHPRVSIVVLNWNSLADKQEWTTYKVVATTPNGFVQRGTYDNNPLRSRKSGWDAECEAAPHGNLRGAMGVV